MSLVPIVLTTELDKISLLIDIKYNQIFNPGKER